MLPLSHPYFDGKIINHNAFVEFFLNTHPLIYADKTFYGYEGAISENVLEHEIYCLLKGLNLPNVVADIKKIMKILPLECFNPDFIMPEDEIYLKNGILKIDGSWSQEKKICKYLINANYDPLHHSPDNYPKKFLAHLNNMLEAEDTLTLQEFMGGCLINSSKIEAMLILVGKGGEGKSTIGFILEKMLGNTIYSSALQNLSSNKFILANLRNKLVYLEDDLEVGALKKTGLLKTLISGKINIHIEEKGKQGLMAHINPRIICFSNHMPEFSHDKSNAIRRRIIPLSAKPIPADRVDNPNIHNELLEELDQIFIWCFDGLRRLIDNNYKFTISRKTEENIDTIMSNRILEEFMEDTQYIIFDPSASASTKDLYISHRNWAVSNAYEPVSEINFSKWLYENHTNYGIAYDNNSRDNNGHRARGYRGIRCYYFPVENNEESNV